MIAPTNADPTPSLEEERAIDSRVMSHTMGIVANPCATTNFVKKVAAAESGVHDCEVDGLIVQPDASLKDPVLPPLLLPTLSRQDTGDFSLSRPPTPKNIQASDVRRSSFRGRGRGRGGRLPPPGVHPPPTTLLGQTTDGHCRPRHAQLDTGFDDIQVVDTSGSESENGTSENDVEADAHDWLASSHSLYGGVALSERSDDDDDEDSGQVDDWLEGPTTDKVAKPQRTISFVVPDSPPDGLSPNEPESVQRVVKDRSIRDTTVVKKKKAQLPTHNLPHPRPISGDWLNSRTMINNYIILESLGVGSYAEVKLCKEKASGQLFAMKFIDRDIMHKHGKLNRQPDALNDIKREIAIMKKLQHPNVLRLFEVMDDPHMNKLFLVLEYMQLGDLLSFQMTIQQQTATPPATTDSVCAPMLDPELHGVALQVLHGLAYLHDQNIVHGDLKPQNLLIGEKGIVKIADFGISQNLYGSKQQLLESKGTPAFMSPEMCSGVQYSGQLADVWAVGATVYMLKFGYLPFVFDKIQNDPLVIPAGIDPALADFFVKIMAKDPARRLTLHEALAHPWITKNRSLRKPLLNVRITVSADEIDSAIHETSSPTHSTASKGALPAVAASPSIAVAPRPSPDDSMHLRELPRSLPKDPPMGAVKSAPLGGPDASHGPIDRGLHLQALHRNGSSKRRSMLQKRNQNISSEEMHFRSERFAQKKSHARLLAKTESGDDLKSEEGSVVSNDDDDGDDSDSDDEDAVAPSMHHLDELLLTTLAPTAQAVVPSAVNVDALTASSANLMLREPCNPALGIRMALASVQGRRTTQEDRCMVIPNILSYARGNAMAVTPAHALMAFVGIYDGHGGVTAAAYLQEHLHKHVLTALPCPLASAPDIASVLQAACRSLDAALCDTLYSNDCPSGSTATFGFLDGSEPGCLRLVLGHVGDCRAVISRQGVAVTLTKDHRCTTQEEADAVVGVMGPQAIINNRINGVLAITRTFGDLEFKGRTLKASERAARVYSQESVGTVLTATPDVIVLDVQPTDDFLLLACDGLWEAMSCDAAVAFVANRLALHGMLQLAAEELTQEAVRCLSSDNVSVIVVQLNKQASDG
ncbi:protein kinase [Achlya hypogyna]|uniref:Protein kinase n=1 Tax=Achlya hypogyna TaxID=1202772 RepID=A0A1V9YL18_ACHHY|nr:protein kinase [Achlya hypogyna]